jgi:hypothetical protein
LLIIGNKLNKKENQIKKMKILLMQGGNRQ